MAKLRRFAGIAFVGVLLAACSSDGDLDNPVSRRFILFNYLDGQDIRQGCGPGTPQTYRFVYVAQREFQVRAYDIAAVQGGGLIRVSILQPEPVGRRYPVTDLLAPWRPDGAEVMVADGDLAALDSALDKSGFWDAAERGLKLPSDGFYWIAVVCRAGAVKFNAWAWPSERFERLVFPAVLEQMDQSAIPKRQPRDDSRYQIIPRTLSARREETGLPYYDLTVGDNGLKDAVSLF